MNYLYINDGTGHFKEIADRSVLRSLGMVSDAAWVDVTGDGNKELIVVGQWMSPRIFSVSGTGLSEVKSNLSGIRGW